MSGSVQISTADAGLLRRPIRVEEVASHGVHGDSARLIQDRAIENGPAHAHRVVDISADDFDLGAGSVDEIEIVTEPIQRHAFDVLQLSVDQDLRLAVTV